MWTTASPAFCKTRDSETLPSEAVGSGDPGAVLPWRCRSDWREPPPKSRAVRRRSVIPCGTATGEPSTAPLLHHPEAADARRGCDHDALLLGRFFPRALVLSCVRSRDMPTGLPTGQGRHRGTRWCAVAVVLSAVARRSGSRTLPAASCPDLERGGRTNPSRYPVAPPSFRSVHAIRAFEPAR